MGPVAFAPLRADDGPLRFGVLAPAGTPRPKTIEDLLGSALAARLDSLEILSRKVFAGKLPGERRSRRRGSSVEFDDYRDYVPGDDLRRIDWNVFARLDRFFIKLFREEEDQALHVVLDATASMDAGMPGKLIFGQQMAMALAWIGLAGRSRVIASIIGAPGRPPMQQLAPVRGRGSVRRVGAFLLDRAWPPEGRATAGSSDWIGALRSLSLSRRGKGVMMLLSDFLIRGDWRQGLNYLGAGGSFDVHCMQILAPGELEPEREAAGVVIGDLRLMDVETGGGTEVTVSAPLLKRYKSRLAEHIESVHRACMARGMSHQLVRSDTDLPSFLTRYLARRGFVR
jgi:hypothetical protein